MIIIFFLINTPILAIIGFIITSLISPTKSFLPIDLTKSPNWFSQNPDLSNNIALGFYIGAILFGLFSIYNIVATLFDHGGSDDEVR